MKMVMQAIALNYKNSIDEVIAEQEKIYSKYLSGVCANLCMSPQEIAQEVINNKSNKIFANLNGKKINDERLLELVMVLQKHIDESVKGEKGERHDFVREFLERNPTVDLKATRYQEHEFCALESAVLSRNKAIIKTLLEFGADFNDAISDQTIHPLLIANFSFKDKELEGFLRYNGVKLSPTYAAELMVEAFTAANFKVMKYCADFLEVAEINRRDERIGGSIFLNIILSSCRNDHSFEIAQRLIDINSDMLNVRMSGRTILETLAATNFLDPEFRKDLFASAVIMDHIDANDGFGQYEIDEDKWFDGTIISSEDKEKIIADAKKRLLQIVEKVVDKAHQLSGSKDQFDDYINHKLDNVFNAALMANFFHNSEVANFLVRAGARVNKESLIPIEAVLPMFQKRASSKKSISAQDAAREREDLRNAYKDLEPDVSEEEIVSLMQSLKGKPVDIEQELKKLDEELRERARILESGISAEISEVKEATPTQVRLAREVVECCERIVQFQRKKLEDDLVNSKSNGASEQEIEGFREQWNQEIRQSNITNFVSDRGFTLLHLVAKFGDVQAVEYVINDFGVDQNRVVTEKKVEKKSAKLTQEVEVKKSALYMAITRRSAGLNVVEAILKSGCMDNEIVKNDVISAISFGFNPAVKLFLEKVKDNNIITSERELGILVNRWNNVANGINNETDKRSIKSSISNFNSEMQLVFRPSKPKNSSPKILRSRTQSVVTDSESIFEDAGVDVANEKLESDFDRFMLESAEQRVALPTQNITDEIVLNPTNGDADFDLTLLPRDVSDLMDYEDINDGLSSTSSKSEYFAPFSPALQSTIIVSENELEKVASEPELNSIAIPNNSPVLQSTPTVLRNELEKLASQLGLNPNAPSFNPQGWSK